MNAENTDQLELKDSWYTAQNLRRTGWKIISEVSLIPSVFRTLRALRDGGKALWHVRPDFMRSAKEFAKKGHLYEITDNDKFADAAYGSEKVSYGTGSSLHYRFKRHSHPAFLVDGDKKQVVETSWKGKKPLAEIGLRHVGRIPN